MRRTSIKHRATIFTTTFALAACATETAPTEEQGPPPRLIDQSPADPVGEHEIRDELGILSRGPRRLSVPQLERSLEVVAGLEPGTIVLEGSLALSLGEPDYLSVTEETLEPSPLFMKFQMDVAGILCPTIADRDEDLPPAGRVLVRHEDVDENVRYLLARFLSLTGPDAEAYVVPLRETFERGASGALGAAGGWQAVCAALVTSPEFLLY